MNSFLSECNFVLRGLQRVVVFINGLLVGVDSVLCLHNRLRVLFQLPVQLVGRFAEPHIGVGDKACFLVVFLNLLIGFLIELILAFKLVVLCFLRHSQLALSVAQTDFVLFCFNQNVGIFAVNLSELFLIGLSNGVILPSLRIGPQRLRAAIDRIGFKIDVVGQIRNSLRQHDENTMIFSLLLRAQFAQRVQLIETVDVIVRDIRRCFRRCDGIITSGSGVAHGAVKFTRRLSQLPDGRNSVVLGSVTERNDSSRQCGHGSYAQHDRTDGAAEHRSHVERFNDFGDCGVCRQCDRCTADYARECCNTLDERRILLHKLAEDIQHVRTGVVGIAQRRGKSIAYGNLEVVVGVLHHIQLGLRGGVSLVGFVRQSDILIPRGICRLYGAVHLVCCQSEGFEHIALANAGKAEVFQHQNSAFALFVQIAKPADKRCQSAQRVRIPHFRERIRRHSRDICEAL